MERDPFFNFDDPAECLLHCYGELKSKEPGISHRYVVAQLGLKSSGVFARMLAGKFLPSPTIIDRLAHVFAWDEAHRNHFALIIECKRVKDPRVQSLLRRMVFGHQPSANFLGEYSEGSIDSEAVLTNR
jgi:hypothetical protein